MLWNLRQSQNPHKVWRKPSKDKNGKSNQKIRSNIENFTWLASKPNETWGIRKYLKICLWNVCSPYLMRARQKMHWRQLCAGSFKYTQWGRVWALIIRCKWNPIIFHLKNISLTNEPFRVNASMWWSWLRKMLIAYRKPIEIEHKPLGGGIYSICVHFSPSWSHGSSWGHKFIFKIYH